MIFFHGTPEGNIKNIKQNGLLDYTADQWLVEAVGSNVCCISNQPSSGEGGSAAFFAYSGADIKFQDGYLIVFDLPQDVFEKKRIAIFDNKTLDDYVRFHFFMRHEFRLVGYELYRKLDHYLYRKDELDSIEKLITHRKSKKRDTLIHSPEDQRSYYKELRTGDRLVYDILEIEVTDEFLGFLRTLGKWRSVHEFLALHFAHVSEEDYLSFQEYAPPSHCDYWRAFYSRFPLRPASPKQEGQTHWFSPEWLKQRSLKERSQNCQILTSSIEPEYILGFLHISTPKGFAPQFRSCRSQGGFSSMVWKEVKKRWG